MPNVTRRPSLPNVPQGISNELHDFLTAVKINWELDTGEHRVNDKKPTVDELIAAGVANADLIK